MLYFHVHTRDGTTRIPLRDKAQRHPGPKYNGAEAADADFEESKHPRNHGKFSSGSSVLGKKEDYITHTDMTNHLKKVVSKEGIKARIRKLAGSKTGIQVFPNSYEASFSNEQQKQIKNIAKVNGLTHVRGLPIDVDQMTHAKGMEFHHTLRKVGGKDAYLASLRPAKDE